MFRRLFLEPGKKGRFWVPADRVDALVTLIRNILERVGTTFKELESCVGKCRSMSIAVPCAILYTRMQYSELSKHERRESAALLQCVRAYAKNWGCGWSWKTVNL